MTAKTTILKLDSERQMLIMAKVANQILPDDLLPSYNNYLFFDRDLYKKKFYTTKLQKLGIYSSIWQSEEHTL